MSTCTVRPGQGFWQIAVEHLGDGNRWREIARENNLLENAVLRSGQVLRLPLQHGHGHYHGNC